MRVREEDDVLTGERCEAVIVTVLPSPPRPAMASFHRTCRVLVSNGLCAQFGDIGFGGRTHLGSGLTGWREGGGLNRVHGRPFKCGKDPRSICCCAVAGFVLRTGQ